MEITIPPVLLITFNRPDEARRVFEQIKLARPSKLYIASDGPRSMKSGEAELVEEVRRLATAVDWPCEVKTRFLNENLGCGRAVSSAIEWFLNDAEEGIILEDDCLPAPAFFRFCAIMLNRYRNDERVALIAGANMSPLIELEHSYGFSTVLSCWGWATWRRTWDKYSLQPKPIEAGEKAVEGLHINAVRFLERTSLKISKGEVHTWDYQLMIQLLRSRQLVAIPRENLILNIGFSGSGAHYAKSGRPWAAPAFAFNPSTNWDEHPPVVTNQDYDQHSLAAGHRGSSRIWRQILKWRILWRRRIRPSTAMLDDIN